VSWQTRDMTFNLRKTLRAIAHPYTLPNSR
jgi:hypothetical protein